MMIGVDKDFIIVGVCKISINDILIIWVVWFYVFKN